MVLFKQIIILLCLAVSCNAQVLDTIIDTNSYKLHFKIIKGNNAAILFESGGGQDMSQWDSIATIVHQHLQATVITYDRAGFGRSSFDTLDYTILREIENLEFALQKFGLKNERLMLVGHSLGGFYNRVYAARNAGQVKGIILVDPRIPSYADMQFAKKYFQSMDRKDYENEYMSLYYLLARMESTSNYVRQLDISPTIPLLDIMAENGPFEDPVENERFKEDQRNLVKGYPNRELIFAKGSSHNIPLDKPAMMIEQIVKFYRRYIAEN